jgi:hypothetical protein
MTKNNVDGGTFFLAIVGLVALMVLLLWGICFVVSLSAEHDARVMKEQCGEGYSRYDYNQVEPGYIKCYKYVNHDTSNVVYDIVKEKQKEP